MFDKESERFWSIWSEFRGEYSEFVEKYEKDIEGYGEGKGMLGKGNGGEKSLGVCMIGWRRFEGFKLNVKKGYEYVVGIFRFGKYYEDGGK